MNIAVFASYLPPHVGGIEAVAESQIKALAAAGHQVSVITSACGATAGIQKVDNYTIRRIPAWNYFEEKLGAVFPVFAPSLWWYSFFAVKEADLVHAHDAFYLTSLAANFWAQVLRKPLVLTQHVDIVPHRKKIVMLAQKIVYATTGRYILHSSDKIIVLNSRVAAFLRQKSVPETNIIFLPNGVDTNTFAPASAKRKSQLRTKYGLPKDKSLVLFVGRFVPKKGFNTLLNLEPLPNADMVFVGGHAPAGHGRTDHHFLGPVGRADMPDVYRMCDIFILPSEGEGFPLTIQEAMASGLAVVTTDDPAYATYGLDGRYISLIRPTPDAITRALHNLLGNPKKLQAAGPYSLDHARKNFSSEIHTMRLLQLYRAVTE